MSSSDNHQHHHHQHSQPTKDLANKAAFKQHKHRKQMKKILLTATITIAILMIAFVLLIYQID